MEEEDIKEILKMPKDLEMFDEYSKFILIGVMARHGLGNVSDRVLAKQIFKQALMMVDERNEISKILKTKKNGK